MLTSPRTCFFNISPVHDAAQARLCIDERLALLASGAPGDALLLYEFLDVLEPDSPASTLTPKARRARLLGLLRELVKQTGTSPHVIIFEDLHWLDDASVEFLLALGDAVAGTRLLLVLNYRSGYQAPWPAWPHLQAVRLADLSASDTDHLVRTRLVDHPVLLPFFPLIVERASGNPFFAE